MAAYHLIAVQTEDKDQTALFQHNRHDQLHLLVVPMEGYHPIVVLTVDKDQTVLCQHNHHDRPLPLVLMVEFHHIVVPMVAKDPTASCLLDQLPARQLLPDALVVAFRRTVVQMVDKGQTALFLLNLRDPQHQADAQMAEFLHIAVRMVDKVPTVLFLHNLLDQQRQQDARTVEFRPIVVPMVDKVQTVLCQLNHHALQLHHAHTVESHHTVVPMEDKVLTASSQLFRQGQPFRQDRQPPPAVRTEGFHRTAVQTGDRDQTASFRGLNRLPDQHDLHLKTSTCHPVPMEDMDQIVSYHLNLQLHDHPQRNNPVALSAVFPPSAVPTVDKVPAV